MTAASRFGVPSTAPAISVPIMPIQLRACLSDNSRIRGCQYGGCGSAIFEPDDFLQTEHIKRSLDGGKIDRKVSDTVKQPQKHSWQITTEQICFGSTQPLQAAGIITFERDVQLPHRQETAGCMTKQSLKCISISSESIRPIHRIARESMNMRHSRFFTVAKLEFSLFPARTQIWKCIMGCSAQVMCANFLIKSQKS
jgi:hypothetical protein